jgi:cytochrome c peroxidase
LTVALHDMTAYTCVTSGAFPDEPSTDIDGGSRTACAFDTPTLRGIFATAPYFHDGSAQTLDDAVGVMLEVGRMDLSDSDRADLLAYLMTL